MTWSSGWSDAEYVISGRLKNDAPEADDSDLFLAHCEPATANVHLWFYVDRPLFPGQAEDKDGMRAPYQYRSTAVVIDGVDHELKQATLTPEEMTGGHELAVDVPRDTPLLALLRNGHTMAVRIDHFTMPAHSLRGAAKAFDAFVKHCKKPRR